VVDEGWAECDLPSLRGIVGELIAYGRLFPTLEQVRDDGPWLAVSSLD
jgi:hypothetical protein